MKLQKGKFYRTRSGEKVECLTTERNDKQPVIMLWEDGDLSFYYLTGEFWLLKKESEFDIISEWSDVVIPWDDYPSWCMSVKMICNETWGMFDFRNQLIDSIPSEYAPKGFEGDWKESKFERPKKD